MTPDELRYRLRALRYSNDKEDLKDSLAICREFLIENNYRVHDPIKIDLDRPVKKYNDLVSLFYDLHDMLYTEELPRTQNKTADLNIAKLFLKSRMGDRHSKTSRDRALAECALIIKTVLLNKAFFTFDRPIGFWMFGTESCRWIIDKALHIVDKENKILSEQRVNQAVVAMCDNLTDDERYGDLEKKLELVRKTED